MPEVDGRLMDDTQLERAAGKGRAIVYHAIGHVENDFDEPAPPPEIRAIESRIVLDPPLVEGLKGLEPGRRIMVVFCFHRSQGFDLLQHPQGDRSRPRRGVFALRSPRRPNSIGVTMVDLVAIEGNVLRVRGLDAINGTPVLDLKPA
jgi:tRNA-Thr(GGU) m(6)t(6)A37 methyltransferase TsaA